MHPSVFGRTVPCVLVDLNTQRDFFDLEGACPVLDLPGIYRCLRRVVAWVKRNQVPVISTLDLHRQLEISRGCAPVRCIEGTPGQSKLEFTVLPNHVYVAGDNTLSVPIDLFNRHQQVIFPQRTRDLFANPKADCFITQLQADEFVVAGAVAEHEVKAVVLGLLARGKPVSILTDGCGAWSESESDLSLRQMVAKGARPISANELLMRKLPRRWRYTRDNLVSAYRPGGYASPALASGPNGRRCVSKLGRPSVARRRNGQPGASSA